MLQAARNASKKRDDGVINNDSDLDDYLTGEIELATNFHNNCAASNEISLPLFAKISNNEL